MAFRQRVAKRCWACHVKVQIAGLCAACAVQPKVVAAWKRAQRRDAQARPQTMTGG